MLKRVISQEIAINTEELGKTVAAADNFDQAHFFTEFTKELRHLCGDRLYYQIYDIYHLLPDEAREVLLMLVTGSVTVSLPKEED